MKYFYFFIFFICSFASNAADVTVEMLNRSGKESMVYSEKIVRINVGDTVFWKATDKGHNVEFIKNGVPDGVDRKTLLKLASRNFFSRCFSAKKLAVSKQGCLRNCGFYLALFLWNPDFNLESLPVNDDVIHN